MLCSNCLNLFDPLLRDGPSSLRARFEPALQSKSHTFEQTSMDHVGERMPIQNSMKIRRKPQSASDLSQTSEEDFGAKHLRPWRQVLRVALIANTSSHASSFLLFFLPLFAACEVRVLHGRLTRIVAGAMQVGDKSADNEKTMEVRSR